MTIPNVPAITDELIAELIDEFEGSVGYEHCHVPREVIAALLSDRADLKRQLAASVIDAERYRWLRSPAAWNGFQLVMEKGGVNLDAAIDAAKGETL